MTGDRFEPEEELRLGPRRPALVARVRRLHWRWGAAAVAVVAAATAVPLIVTAHHSRQPAWAHSAAPGVSPAPRGPSSAAPKPRSGRPTVRHLGRNILGIQGSWELFGRGDGAVVRVQFGRGRITTTPVPPLTSDGPVYFLATRHAALIRPLDYVPGWVVPDGKPARVPPTAFNCGGPVLPGPKADEVWVAPCHGSQRRLLLTSATGERAGVSLHVPPAGSPITALPDGRGSVVFAGVDFAGSPATLDVTPRRSTLVTRAQLLAVGPTRWLIAHCPHRRCHAVVVNRSTGARHRLATVLPLMGMPGPISPNGRTAAFITAGTTPRAIELVDLRTGKARVLTLSPDLHDLQTMVWSPNSRWLFTVDRHGLLYAASRRSAEITALTPWLHLPALRQLAIRPARPAPISALRH